MRRHRHCRFQLLPFDTHGLPVPARLCCTYTGHRAETASDARLPANLRDLFILFKGKISNINTSQTPDIHREGGGTLGVSSTELLLLLSRSNN